MLNAMVYIIQMERSREARAAQRAKKLGRITKNDVVSKSMYTYYV